MSEEEKHEEELIRKINQLTNEFDETQDARRNPILNPKDSHSVETWDDSKKVSRDISENETSHR
jgi:hypothetical protein